MSAVSTYRVIGVMSGTSIDGLDLCHVEFKLENKSWTFRILNDETVSYSKEWVEVLKNAHLLSSSEIDELDREYTLFLAQTINAFKIKCQHIDLICSHGHTIWHEPDKGITKQIGNLKLLQELTNTIVVCDFRVNDVKLGGQGAPLVPLGDQLLSGDYEYCVNIGGFANISYNRNKSRIAYDICPANKVLNRYAELRGHHYDKNGALAKKGRCNNTLLKKLNGLGYYKNPPPKSLGVEWVENEIFPVIEAFDISINDKLNTFCHHIANQLMRSFKKNKPRVLLTGGGRAAAPEFPAPRDSSAD